MTPVASSWPSARTSAIELRIRAARRVQPRHAGDELERSREHVRALHHPAAARARPLDDLRVRGRGYLLVGRTPPDVLGLEREASPLEHEIDRGMSVVHGPAGQQGAGRAPHPVGVAVGGDADPDREPRPRAALEVAFAVVVDRAERPQLEAREEQPSGLARGEGVRAPTAERAQAPGDGRAIAAERVGVDEHPDVAVERELVDRTRPLGELERELAHGPQPIERHEELADADRDVPVRLVVDERVEDRGDRAIAIVAARERELQHVGQLGAIDVARQPDPRRPDADELVVRAIATALGRAMQLIAEHHPRAQVGREPVAEPDGQPLAG